MKSPTWLVPSLLALVAACGCASSEAAGKKPELTGKPQRVAVFDYRSKKRFELVNESHTSRLEQYSSKRERADRKVQSDEVIAGLIDLLRDEGFERLSQAGASPAEGDASLAMSLEIEDRGQVAHAEGRKGMAAADRQKLLGMVQNVLDVYNQTYGLQAVDKTSADEAFKNPAVNTRFKAPKVIDNKP